jgi:type I restriction enzyme, S subunit
VSELQPEKWLITTIDEVTTNTAQRQPRQDENFIYIDIGSIDREQKIISTPEEMLGKDAPSRARKVVQTGDILVSTTRPNLNAVAMVPEKFNNQIASTGFDVLRAPNIDPRWLFYIVRTTDFVQAMSELVQGALYPAIRSKDIRSFEIPLAPLNEQKRIADKLDRLLAKVDACRERCDRIPLILKRFRQSVLAAATSGELTEDWREENNLNLDWKEYPLSDLTEKVTDGEHLTPKRTSSGKFLLSARNILNGSIVLEDVDYVDDLEFKRIRKRCDPSIGDVLLSCSGSVGRVAIVDQDNCYVMVRSVAMIRPRKELLSTYLMYGLQSPNLQSQIAEKSRATAQANIFLGAIKSLVLPLPTLTEQQEIISRVDKLFTFADRLETRYQKARKKCDQLTPALLEKAFQGELVPQDPNDEPASVLLERIKSLRFSAEAKQTKPRRRKTAPSR